MSAALLNVDLGNSQGDKIGFAAVGQTTNDYWNGCYFPNVSPANFVNLKWSNTNSSGIGMTVLNGAGHWANGASDIMYSGYVYSQSVPGTTTITLTNVPTGTYDFYVYGHSPSDADNGTFTLDSAGVNYGTNGTTV